MNQHRDSGAAAVEFAIVLPVLVLLVFGIIQFGWYFHASTEMAGGVRQAARDMSIHDKADQAKQVAVDDMPTLNLSKAAVTVSVPGGSCDAGEFVTVTATYTSPMPNFIPGLSSTIVREGVAQCVG